MGERGIIEHQYSVVGGLERGSQPSPRARLCKQHNGRHPRNSLRDEELDSIRPWHDSQLLAKEANHTPWTPGSSDEPAVERWDPPRVVDPSPDHEGAHWGINLSNSQPITRLYITWKLLSGIIAAKMSRHLAQYSRAQKGAGSDTRGAKHQLLLDRRSFWRL